MSEILERTQGVGRIEDDHDRIAFDAAAKTSPNDALREVASSRT